MAITAQNATVYQGAALEIDITVTNQAGEPLELAAIPVFYRLAKRAYTTTLLLIDDADIGTAANIATVVLTREQSLALPAGVYYHELYTTDELLAETDDTVLMTGNLTVLAAQIAQHA